MDRHIVHWAVRVWTLSLRVSPGVQQVAVRRFWRRGIAGALPLLFFAALPAAAQDQGLDPLLLASRSETTAATDVEARGFQLYRLPFSFHLRSLEKHPWGLRVTLPVSLSSLTITGVSDVGGFVEKLGIAAIIPGLEVEIPVGSRTLVRPFGEVGIGKSSDSFSRSVLRGGPARAHHYGPETVARHLWRQDLGTEDTEIRRRRHPIREF